MITKTYMANDQTVTRKWYVVDATNMPLGRVASQVAAVLRGKNKPTFTPHVDTGDFVIVLNCDKAIFTGKKLEQKTKFSHSMYHGGAKEVRLSKLMEDDSASVMYEAVCGMLPKNSLGRKMAKKLRVYKDDKHEHQAQKPEVLQLQVKRYN